MNSNIFWTYIWDKEKKWKNEEIRESISKQWMPEARRMKQTYLKLLSYNNDDIKLKKDNRILRKSLRNIEFGYKYILSNKLHYINHLKLLILGRSEYGEKKELFGMRVIISGKLTGKKKKRKIIRADRTPFNSLRYGITKSHYIIKSKWGVIGIKIFN